MTGTALAGRDTAGAKLGMWLFLFTEILLFGGLFLLYAVYRTKHVAEFHAAAEGLNRLAGTANTLVLLTSSLTMALSIAELRKGRRGRSLLFQSLTIVFACVFLGVKYFEWSTKIGHGIFPDSPELMKLPKGEMLFYGLYFVMTGLHGVHVLAGIGVLIYMLISTVNGKITADDPIRLENSGLYWHLVDTIWVYLFPLFYLIT